MRTISLDQLTVLDARPAELVEIAARAGYDAVSTIMNGIPEVRVISLRAGDPDTLALHRRIKDTGVFINVADGFPISPQVPMEQLRAGVTLMAELGARKIVTLNFDPDANRALDSFWTLREYCSAAGLPLLIEFTPISQIASLHDALAFRAAAGGEGIQVLVDLLHLNQSGGAQAEVAALEPGLMGGAQLCDGPVKASMAAYRYSSIHERGIPGEGELPARAFLDALPHDRVFGIEVPLHGWALAGASALDRATLLINATRALLGEQAETSVLVPVSKVACRRLSKQPFKDAMNGAN